METISTKTLSYEDFTAAAAKLGCTVAAIRAVSEVESAGSGFDKQGRPKILYERHIFSRLTGGKYDRLAPALSSKSPGGYTKDEYSRLEDAKKLNTSAALSSASWGMFQILGVNYKQCGFQGVEEFVNSMSTAQGHLNAFVNFILADKRLLTAIRTKNWTKFASIYNGPNFKKYEYDTRIAQAHAKMIKTDISNVTSSVAQVKAVQLALSERKFNVGNIDGDYGPKTRDAIIAFEKYYQLPVTGQITQTLLDRLRISR